MGTTTERGVGRNLRDEAVAPEKLAAEKGPV